MEEMRESEARYTKLSHAIEKQTKEEKDSQGKMSELLREKEVLLKENEKHILEISHKNIENDKMTYH